MTVYDSLSIVDQFEERTDNRTAVKRACDVMLRYLMELKRPLPDVAAQSVKIAREYCAGSRGIQSLHDEDKRISNFLRNASARSNGTVSVVRATGALVRLLQEPTWGGGASEALSNFLNWVDEFEQDHTMFKRLLEGAFPIPVPLVFFDVVDPRPSCKWTLTKYNDHEASLLPLELQDKFFIDRLTDGERSDVEAFKKLLVDLENEFEPI
ncbi:hypothetical protein [Bradyrhizobium ivorense]|nr:hypothetical protein [Bradyrhizobium ivorense]